MALLPPGALIEIAKVFTFGAQKYGEDNWRNGIGYRRLISASLRHINAYNAGDNLDPESGISHLAHAACNILMLLEYDNLGLGKDDRWKK